MDSQSTLTDDKGRLAVRCWIRSGGMATERVDIKALLGHESIATTQIYSHVGQERMEQVVGRL